MQAVLFVSLFLLGFSGCAEGCTALTRCTPWFDLLALASRGDMDVLKEGVCMRLKKNTLQCIHDNEHDCSTSQKSLAGQRYNFAVTICELLAQTLESQHCPVVRECTNWSKALAEANKGNITRLDQHVCPALAEVDNCVQEKGEGCSGNDLGTASFFKAYAEYACSEEGRKVISMLEDDTSCWHDRDVHLKVSKGIWACQNIYLKRTGQPLFKAQEKRSNKVCSAYEKQRRCHLHHLKKHCGEAEVQYYTQQSRAYGHHALHCQRKRSIAV